MFVSLPGIFLNMHAFTTCAANIPWISLRTSSARSRLNYLGPTAASKLHQDHLFLAEGPRYLDTVQHTACNNLQDLPAYWEPMKYSSHGNGTSHYWQIHTESVTTRLTMHVPKCVSCRDAHVGPHLGRGMAIGCWRFIQRDARRVCYSKYPYKALPHLRHVSLVNLLWWWDVLRPLAMARLSYCASW